jgi:hypothetical protein
MYTYFTDVHFIYEQSFYDQSLAVIISVVFTTTKSWFSHVECLATSSTIV